MKEFWLTLNEDGSTTHICLNQKLDDRPQLQLIEKWAYDDINRMESELRSDLDGKETELEHARRSIRIFQKDRDEAWAKLKIAVDALKNMASGYYPSHQRETSEALASMRDCAKNALATLETDTSAVPQAERQKDE